MAGEVQLLLRGEDTHAHAFSALEISGSALDEGGLRQIEFGRDGLHVLRAEASRVKHDGKRIAFERGVGEYVYDEVFECHLFLQISALGCSPSAGSRRSLFVRSRWIIEQKFDRAMHRYVSD
jgi:hypothetical protein